MTTKRKKELDFAIIGNPSSGITTLFNQMSGGITHEGHFCSSATKTKEGPVGGHPGINVIELPGIYSLADYTVDDLSTRNILLGLRRKNNKMSFGAKCPDVIINIVDATNLERNLYLTLQLMELEMPMLIALNMSDKIEANDMDINIQKLSEALTIPIVPISASKNEGIHDLIHYAKETALNHTVPHKIDFCEGHVHTAIHSIAHIVEIPAQSRKLPVRFCATKLVEGDKPIHGCLGLDKNDLEIVEEIISDMESHLGTDREAAMADMRYEYIDKLCRETVKKPGPITREQLRSLKIDRVLTHRILAIPIFICIMFLVFYFTFGPLGGTLSNLLSAVISEGIEGLSTVLSKGGASPAFHALVIDGVCRGIGSVLSFLPTIAVLFFFLSILEDSGYTPRVAFVMDKLLRRLGLSGSSIVPMLIGFGCSVPAIMATRSLPSKRDRRLTMCLIPFMSCSAKLPIYVMFIGALFDGHKAAIMCGIYFTGVLVAIICSFIFNKTAFKGPPVPFVMVLPPYRVPAAKSVLLRMWENVKGFIKKAFTVIFIATIIIWFLQSFDFGLHMVAQSEDSMLAAIGKAIAPIFAPLGFDDWRAATALLTGLSAKEAVVSTLTVLMGASGSVGLASVLTTIFTPLSGFAFMVFCLLYVPCIATLTTLSREMGGWKYSIAIAFSQVCVAWIVAFIVFNVGSLFL